MGLPWWWQIGGKPRQGRRQGQAARQPDPPSFLGNATAAKKTPKNAARSIKGESAAGLSGIVSGGHAKPDQHGCGIHHLGDSATRAFGREAFSRQVRVRGFIVLERMRRRKPYPQIHLPTRPSQMPIRNTNVLVNERRGRYIGLRLNSQQAVTT